jgi:hypothetical protein
MDNFVSSVALTMAGLLAGPPIAIAAFVLTRWRRPAWLRRLIIGAASLLLIIIAASALGFSFEKTLANFVSFAVGCLAYSFLAVSCWQIRFLPLRIVALLGAAIPIGVGYLLSTIGMLGLMLVVGDYSVAPYKIEQMESGLVCRVTGWGSAITDSGYTVHLYRTWGWLPLIERSVVSISINESASARSIDAPAGATCADALGKYRG